MKDVAEQIQAVFDGDIKTDKKTLTAYSHDASIYELIPTAVLEPKHSNDIEQVVSFVAKNKLDYPSLSITARGAGTDMSGGAISGSLILDMTKYFNTIHPYTGDLLHAEPGVHMRDIDTLLGTTHLIGCVPASRAWCTLGGMVGNNSGGERSLQYGNADKSVRELKVVFADGKQYTVKPLNKRELAIKMKKQDFEGKLYKRLFTLIENNYDDIRNARPKVNKNSMGYNLWSVWDRETGIFDMTQLITGSQGTLGVVTDIVIQTHRKALHNGLLIIYIEKQSQLEEVIQTVLRHKPVTFEGFDDVTFDLGIKYFSTFRQQLGTKEYLKQQAILLGQAARFRGHIPSMVLMVEFEDKSIPKIDSRITELRKDLSKFRLKTTVEHDDANSALFWNIRRASLSLLRNRVHGKFAAPFIDDMTVQPRHIHNFLPEARAIMRRYKLPATIAGHFGDGNFHIIPLIDIVSQKEHAKLEPIMRELIPVVLKYGGTMAGEHNDGMIRGPWLEAMFGVDMYNHFKTVKEIFDPHYIFNPHKKTDASWEYGMKHIRKNNN
ncbi:MAG: FAD-binding oxidoreductase [Candidatus Saccharimonadales bacterium]